MKTIHIFYSFFPMLFLFVLMFSITANITIVFPRNAIQKVASDKQMVLIRRFASQLELQRLEILKTLGIHDSYFKGLSALRNAHDDLSFSLLKGDEVATLLKNTDGEASFNLLKAITENDKKKAFELLQDLDLDQFLASRKVKRLEIHIQYMINHLQNIAPKIFEINEQYSNIIQSLYAISNNLKEKRLLLRAKEGIKVSTKKTSIAKLLLETEKLQKHTELLVKLHSTPNPELEIRSLLNQISFEG